MNVGFFVLEMLRSLGAVTLETLLMIAASRKKYIGKSGKSIAGLFLRNGRETKDFKTRKDPSIHCPSRDGRICINVES